MPNTREKLIEILRGAINTHTEKKEQWILGGKVGEEPMLFGSFADHLIANGVTVQGWISVKDRLPTPYMPVLVCKQPLGGQQPFMTVDYITIGYGETKIWVGDIGTWKNEVTHWMPLPMPPKGE